MRVGALMIAVAVALGGCNLVFGLDPPVTGDRDGGDDDGDGGDGGDDGGSIDARDPCTEAGVIFCATWSAGLWDDGFRQQSTILGGASIGVVDLGRRFARAHLDDSSLVGEATIDAALSQMGPRHYRIRMLMRGGLACATGLDGTVPIHMLSLRFPAAGIQTFVRRDGPTVSYGTDTPAGSAFTSLIAAELGVTFHDVDLDVDFTGAAPGVLLTIDGDAGPRIGFPQMPLASQTAAIVVGLRAEGSQPDCFMDYDDLSVSVLPD